MLDALANIVGILQTVWGYLANLLGSLYIFIDILAGSIVLPLELVGFMPALLGASVTAVISLAVVKLIVGR